MSRKPTFNPFPGLRPFGIEEDYLFFGREEQVSELLGLLREHRFLAVVGTSGSGKSSLVRAGLLPALHGGTLTQAGSSWEVLLLRPGGDPMTNLGHALLDADLYDREDDESLPRVKATLTRSRTGLVEAVRQSDLPAETNLLVVVDQFEELFRYRDSGVSGQEGAAAFVKLLLAATGQQEQPIYVAITMRSDYLGDCAQIPGLAEAVNDGEYLIPRLSRSQRRAAIEKPVHVGGGKIAAPLIHKLLNEVGDDADQLPVLQHALMRIWDHWTADGSADQPINLKHYEQVGGLQEALSQHADEVYAELPDDRHRLLAEKLFQAITERGPDNRGIRRPTRFHQLCEIVGGNPSEVTLVIDAFRRAGRTFLMPPEGVELTSETVVDISHESLMRVWRQLGQWVEKESQSARIYRRLADTAVLHQEGKAGLYHDPDLQIASSWRETLAPSEAWAARYHQDFAQAMAFLDASREAGIAAENEREAARQREIETARKLADAERQRAETVSQSARRLRSMVGGLALVAIVAVVASLVALNSWRTAEAAKRAALLSEQAAKLSEDSAKHSAEVAQNEATRATASEAVAVAAQTALQDKKYSSDMTLAQHAYNDGNIDAVSAQLLDHVPGPGEPDSRGIEWYLWWNAGHQESTVVNRGGSHVFSVVISPDGRFAADSRWPNNIRIRETAETQTVKSFSVAGAGELHWLRFSLDSSMLAAVSGNRVYRFGTMDATSLDSVQAPVRLRGLSFSPTQDAIVSGGNDGRIYAWDSVSWVRSDFLASTESLPIWSVAYSPDGGHLAVGTDGGRNDGYAILGADSPLILWDTVDHSIQKTAEGHTARITSVAWSPDGEYLASGSADETVRVWTHDLSPVQTLGSLARVSEVAFSPDGKYLAAGTGKDNAIRVWSTETWELVTTIKGHSKPVSSIAFDPRGGALWSGSEDRTIKTWDIEQLLDKPVSVLRDPALRTMLSGTDQSVVASDGRTLFCSGPDARIERYDLASQAAMSPWSDGKSFRQAAFSDDGTVMTAVSADGLVQVWRTDSEEPIAEAQMPVEDLSTLHMLGVSRGATKVVWTAGNPLDVTVVDIKSKDRQQAPVGLNNGGWKFMTISPDATQLALKSGFGFGLGDISDSQPEGTTTPVPRSFQGAGLAHSFVFSSDGTIGAAPTFDSVIHLWDLESDLSLKTLTGHSSQVYCAAFSQDGRRLLSGSEDGTVRVWSVETGDSLTTLRGHRGPVNWVGFRKNESEIISISRSDGTVRIWHAAAREELKKDPLYWSELAEHHQQAERPAEAIAAYSEAIRLSPQNADLLLDRLELAYGLRQNDSAIADSIRVISLGRADSQFVDRARSMAGQTPLAANSGEHKLSWRYSFQQPGNEWNDPDFDDATWKVGVSPFGAGAFAATTWGAASDIWLRCEFHLDAPVSKPLFFDTYCDDEAELFLNGVRAAKALWVGREYQTVACSHEAAAVLKQGRNVLAVHCQNAGGNTGIDAGLFADQGPQRWIDLLSEALKADPDNPHLLQARMQALAEQGDVELAAADSAVLLPLLRDEVEAELVSPDVRWPTFAGLMADLLVIDFQAEVSSDWQVLELLDVQSAGGATLTTLPDGSVLASGTNPDSDMYTIIAETNLTNIAALRIEALTDLSLPRGGPGRDSTNDLGNFAIDELSISSAPRTQSESNSPASFDEAWTDHTNGTLEQLVEGHWNTGGGGGQPHRAFFHLDQTISHADGVRLVWQMQFQRNPDWPGQNLGRFRLSAAADEIAWRNTILANGLQDIHGAWDRLAAAYFLVGDTQALDHLIEHKPQSAAGIGDLYASAEDWQRAIDTYSRQISPDTTNASLLIKRGEAYAALAQWNNAEGDWHRAAQLQPGVLSESFDRHRLEGRWQAAAKLGTMLIERDPNNRFLWLRTAPAFVLAGDEPGYREFCRRMVEQFADTTNQAIAESTCKACLLLPGIVDISQLPLKAFAQPLDRGTSPAGLRPWAWAARALVAYRNGDVGQVGPYIEKGWESQPSLAARALTYSIAALDRHGRGDFEGAREALGHVTRILDQELPASDANSLHDWLMPQILAGEAQKLLRDENTPDTASNSET